MQERFEELARIMNDPIYFAEKYFYIISLDHAVKAGKCVYGDSKINIKNKKTGKIEEISIAEFFKRFEK